MFRILVSDKISEEGLQPLLNSSHIMLVNKNVADAGEELETADALLVRSATQVTEELMKKMPQLKIVARAGVGVDNIDVEAATKLGIVVINAPDGNTISTTEHTFAMMASMLRHIPQATVSVKSNEWNRNAFVGTEMRGKTLGIVGLGRIGSELAKRARAFEMNVIVFDPFLTEERAYKIGVTTASLDELLSTADIITVHTPLTKETKGLLNEKTLSKTKKGVYLINCARGGIIEEAAVIPLLESGHIRGIALDVFETEPPENTSLLQYEQVIATPHLGASTKEAQLNVASQVSEEVLAFFNGEPVTSSINLPTISKEVYEKIMPFYQLAKKMGNFVSQCMAEPVNEISVAYEGSVGELQTAAITKSLIAGFLSPRVASTVNEVNAGMIAKERGISFSEKISNETSGYENCLTVKVVGNKSVFSIKGTYIPHYGERIVELNGFNIDFYPDGHLLYIQHSDKPGAIGRVGRLLGDHSINIATMQVGRKQRGGDAIMMLSFDKAVTERVVSELNDLEGIVSVRTIDL
ncbi:phosphoglycerate dehydrogenase [Bacillus lacus]|uniref:D-3-phosphoglycerate dehydrogenase n=1 Tax=Metabacillus lacus TaxID=1983721 RepID=A0A7X2IXQ2_9BACI|nr:phosphoglycerate dehydrogenase [Metabacillus lacus]MRX71038.1 phosphoglycerate dehydrogenase [Metabacillus lacus]